MRRGYEYFNRILQIDGDNPDFMFTRVMERAREKYENGAHPREVSRRMDISFIAIEKYASSRGLEVSDWLDELALDTVCWYEKVADLRDKSQPVVNT